MERISIEEFRESGALWWINQQLHLFGLAICVSLDENGIAKDMYPAKVNYRGFTEQCNDVGYEKLTKYLAENGNKLLEVFKYDELS